MKESLSLGFSNSSAVIINKRNPEIVGNVLLPQDKCHRFKTFVYHFSLKVLKWKNYPYFFLTPNLTMDNQKDCQLSIIVFSSNQFQPFFHTHFQFLVQHVSFLKSGADMIKKKVFSLSSNSFALMYPENFTFSCPNFGILILY